MEVGGEGSSTKSQSKEVCHQLHEVVEACKKSVFGTHVDARMVRKSHTRDLETSHRENRTGRKRRFVT